MMPSPATLLDALARRLRANPPPGISADYADGFFQRNRKALLALLEARCGERCAREIRPVPPQSGLRIGLADMVEAMMVEGLPAQPEPRTITAALQAAMATFGAQAGVGSESSRDGRRFYHARVSRPEEAPVLAAFWEDSIPLNGVWQGTGELFPAVEVAGHFALHLLRLHHLRSEDDMDAAAWSNTFSAVLLERTFVANAALPAVVLRNPVAARVLWKAENAHLVVLKGLVPSAEVHFRVAEDGSFADIRDEQIPGELDERNSLILDGTPYRTVTQVHPLELPTDALQQWKQLFADYDILQPFPQLHRPIHRHPPEDRVAWFTALTGRKLLRADTTRLHLNFRKQAIRIVWSAKDGRIERIGGQSVDPRFDTTLTRLSDRDWSELVYALEDLLE